MVHVSLRSTPPAPPTVLKARAGGVVVEVVPDAAFHDEAYPILLVQVQLSTLSRMHPLVWYSL